MSKINIGHRIFTCRQESGLTLPKLAKKAHVSKGYLWQVESGDKKNPSLEFLDKIAGALEIELIGLMFSETVIKTKTWQEKVTAFCNDLAEVHKRHGLEIVTTREGVEFREANIIGVVPMFSESATALDQVAYIHEEKETN